MRRFACAAAVAGVVGTVVASSALAATEWKWKGTTSAWGTPSNWSQGDVPDVDTETPIFDSTGSSTTVDLGGNSYAAGWITLSGKNYTLKNGTILCGKSRAIQADSGTQTVTAAIKPSNTYQLTSNGSAVLTAASAKFTGSGTNPLAFGFDGSSTAGNALQSLDYAGTLSGGATYGVRKTGTGTWSIGSIASTVNGWLHLEDGTFTITGTAAYSGATEFRPILASQTAAALYVNGSITNTSALNFAPSPSTGFTHVSARLGGSGLITVQSGNISISHSVAGRTVTIAPGRAANTVAALGLTARNANKLLLGSGGVYEVNLLDAMGGAGVGYDTLNVAEGQVAFSATSANPFTIKLSSLQADGLVGPMSRFNPSGGYAWTILTAAAFSTGGAELFSAEKFMLDTTGIANTGFDSSKLQLQTSGSSLQLVYGTIPEPSCAGLLLLGTGILMHRRRLA